MTGWYFEKSLISENLPVMNVNHNIHTFFKLKRYVFVGGDRVIPAKKDPCFFSDGLISVKPEMISNEGKEE